MIGQIDGFYIAAQIRLVRQVHKGTILILEGETDARVFDRFIDKKLCDIEVAFGKRNVIDGLDLLEDEGVPGVVGVIDADFDRLNGTTYHVENLCITDLHDLDLTIFASSAFDRLLGEHADVELLKTNFCNDLCAVREKIVTASLPLAYCRFISAYRSLNLYFKELRFEQIVTEDNLSIDLDELVMQLISRSSTRCTPTDLKSYIGTEEIKKFDHYQITNGHDVASILGIALRKLLATRRTVQTWASEIEAALRLAFDWEAFAGTALYRCLRGWEGDNRPYRIFRVQPS